MGGLPLTGGSGCPFLRGKVCPRDLLFVGEGGVGPVTGRDFVAADGGAPGVGALPLTGGSGCPFVPGGLLFDGLSEGADCA